MASLSLIETTERELKRFKSKFREDLFLVKGLDTVSSDDVLVSLFDSVLDRQREAIEAKPDDRVIFEIQNGESAANPLWFSLRRVDQLNGRVIVDKLNRVLNSNDGFLSDGQLKVSYIHVPTPEAGGGNDPLRPPNESIEQWFQRKVLSKTIFSPDNVLDQMCLTRSVAVAMAQEGMHRQAFYKMKSPGSIPQRKEALKLCEMAGLDSMQPCGLDEVQKLQSVLPEYRLCVYTDQRGKECVFKGKYGAGKKNIHLLLHNNHFSAILYPCKAFDFNYLCDKCVVYFNNKGQHKCEGSCWRCLGPDAHDTLPLITCNMCLHKFAGQECFDNHKQMNLPNGGLTKCHTYKFCPLCDRSYKVSKKPHMCGFVRCKFCKEQVAENHLCYMQPWEEKEKKPRVDYITIYYDIETTQNTPLEGKPNNYVHKPNLLVTQAVCDKCIHIPQNDYFCVTCKTRQHTFHNLDDPNINVIGQFLDYLQSFTGKTELLLVAHNAKSFDALFVIHELVARKLIPELILQGAKVLCMKVGKWKFIDSLMFLPMALSAMPKSFALNELKKGYWPFMANKPENYTYVGPLLDRDLYCMSTMNSKAASNFNQWYDNQVASNTVFDFRRELFDYCISDVTILRQSCQAFRLLFEQIAGFDPMFNCITLSSACMAAYRRNFLTPNTIGIVPTGGYHGRGKQSHIALQWLDFESFKLGKTIKTVYTDREVSVLGRRVDGYIELSRPNGSIERRIYQFHGDYWHQCPKHFPPNGDSEDNRYENTVRLTQLFRRHGFTVLEKWECEFKDDLLNDPDTKAFFLTHPTTRVPPLVLRDALCGGRTSAMRSFHQVDLSKGETIKMADVISEYPNANLRGEYPYGHPTIYLEGDVTMPPVKDWNGIIKCTVLPPRDLFIPVLPYKCNAKLMFPLCRTCAEGEQEEMCHHEDSSLRQLTGTWCAPELHKALEKGYVISRVHEIYQYPGTMVFDPKTGQNGVLSAYVRCFMALKIQASGWPSDCVTEKDKNDYIEGILKFDGITVDPTKIDFNPALRTLSKLILNSFWGKMGEKTLRPKTQFVYDYSKLMNIVSDPTINVSGIVPLGDECLQVTYMPVEDSDESLPTSSLLHAAFTTCFGRLQLYKYLDMVKERALYCDTDSCAYISRPGLPDLPIGTHLGDLTDQVEESYGPGSYIVEFVAGGPKNYAFRVAVGGDLNKTKLTIKVRGVTINKSCEELVTFDNLKSMVLGEKQKVTVHIPHQIARLPSWNIVTRPASKNWQAVNTKRRRVDTCHTVPHGFNAWEGEDPEIQELMEVMDLLAQ
ncbi:hypothetical protein O181_072330 [Austropuccinia psidii MF-1]|uniref:Probable DNA polymerase n=1 Tax=Austropuccinia psidii MF-1 TaxID=1389203 RepID=A0A9Q3IAY1_9BASI|nr:hypothetical protein [Austropuccinia psidii MF-1]